MKSYKVFTFERGQNHWMQQYAESIAPIRRAMQEKHLQIQYISIRDYGKGRYHKIDDTLYGGGAGLLVRPDVYLKAIQAHHQEGDVYVALDPKGHLWSQDLAKQLSAHDSLVFLPGRYEGLDARIQILTKAIPISLGNYVISNGEIAALICIDTLTRLIPGACLNFESVEKDSWYGSYFLEADQYTKPAIYEGLEVPDILRNGNHQKIEEWKYQNAFENSIQYVPRFIWKHEFQEQDFSLLYTWMRKHFAVHSRVLPVDSNEKKRKKNRNIGDKK